MDETLWVGPVVVGEGGRGKSEHNIAGADASAARVVDRR